MNRILLILFFLIAACKRPVLNQADLFDGASVLKLSGHVLSQQSATIFELSPELPSGKVEKVSYLHFEPQELRLPLDSIGTAAFGDMLHRVYGLTLKRNMGAFGGMMKSYFEYFDKFQTLSLTSLEHGGKTWQSLLKKHNEENHYWQSFYTTHGGNLIFITFFYACEPNESTIPTTELTKYLDAIRFNPQPSNAQ
ncbi:MAG: hypothetical protein ACK4XY_00440 [Chloroherpetonaceae bacterium]